MHRFYLPSVVPGEEIPLSRGDSRKASRILKLVPGDRVVLWEESGKEYQALITQVTGPFVYVRTVEEMVNQAESPLDITLVQGIPKGDKLELIIQKAVEIGAARILPVLTERTVAQVPPERRKNRLQRWQTIAREAARQSGRVRIPEIGEIITLEQLWSGLEPEAVKLLLWERESAGMKSYLKSNTPTPGVPIYLIVGPEGGLGLEEVAQGVAAGCVPLSLGCRILRTETAGLVGLSLILYEWGDLGGS